MSILLDSLKQKNDQDGIVVPSVHDSHYDDEMLNDDALIKSVFRWKLISLFLFVSLLLSFLYINFKTPEIVIKSSKTLSKTEESESKSNKIDGDSTNTQVTNQYKPQKRQVEKEPVNKKIVTSTQQQANIGNEKNTVLKKIAYEELSTDILTELPSLDISSSAVSNNEKKSFIVLNNTFYGVGERIAPDLKLITIGKEKALFQYKDLLISKKYK